MKTRQQIYSQEAASILRDITMYRVLWREQLLRLYPGKQEQVKNLLDFLVRQDRIFYENGSGLYYADPQSLKTMDKGLLKSVWVLVDFIDRVEFHSVCEFPSKIIFFSDGEVYEIVYAAYGQETLINHLLSGKKDTSRYIVLVDKVEQVNALQVPNANGFCTVARDGTVQYYKKE